MNTEPREGHEVTWLSIAANLLLAASKCVIGYFGQSRALVADGLHSLTDLATDAGVLVGLHVSKKPPDERHPYGHHRIASLVTLSIGGALVLFCLLLIVDSIRSLHAGEAVVPHWPTLLVAVGSIGIKEFLYRRTRRIARRLHSQMLMANAVHHRTDSLTSLIAVVGIGGAMLLGEGWAFLDTVVAVALGGYLGLQGLHIVRNALNDLMDSAPEKSVIDDLREHILPVEGAMAYHEFRARRVGDAIEVDFHLLVPPEMNITEAHAVAGRVKEAILDRHPEVVSVLIHIEPALPKYRVERGVSDGPLITDNRGAD